MPFIRHCIIDTNTNIVINIIDYETVQTELPLGLEPHLLCIPSETGQINGTYDNGVITNLPDPVILGM